MGIILIRVVASHVGHAHPALFSLQGGRGNQLSDQEQVFEFGHPHQFMIVVRLDIIDTAFQFIQLLKAYLQSLLRLDIPHVLRP